MKLARKHHRIPHTTITRLVYPIHSATSGSSPQSDRQTTAQFHNEVPHVKKTKTFHVHTGHPAGIRDQLRTIGPCAKKRSPNRRSVNQRRTVKILFEMSDTCQIYQNRPAHRSSPSTCQRVKKQCPGHRAKSPQTRPNRERPVSAAAARRSTISREKGGKFLQKHHTSGRVFQRTDLRRSSPDFDRV